MCWLNDQKSTLNWPHKFRRFLKLAEETPKHATFCKEKCTPSDFKSTCSALATSGLAFHSSPLSLQHGLSTTGKLLHEGLALLCFLCVSVCLSACIPVCQFMYVCIRTYVCTYVRMCLYDMCVCVYVCMNGEWMHACMMHACVHLCMYPCHASMHPVIRVCMLYACCMHCVCIMHVVCIYVMHLCNACM